MGQYVLIIDDNVDWSLEISEVLHEEGYDVETAEDGSAGMEKLEQTKPAFVILDVHLPHICGFDLLRHIRQQLGSTIPVLMVSSDDQAHLMAQALLEGACSFLRKPVAGELLLRAIERFLNPPVRAESDSPRRIEEGDEETSDPR